LIGWVSYIALVATVLVAMGLGVTTLLYGLPGWRITVLYSVVMAAGIGLASAFGPVLGSFVLAVLWLAGTLTLLLFAPPPRQRASRE
jgi:hypothetical protein